MGLSSWKLLLAFLKTLLKSLLLKDIKILFALVFVSCFTNLSLPLLIGGNPSFSLEFFIYEKLKYPSLWPQALALILFQSVVVFLICWRAFSGRIDIRSSLSFKKIYLLPHHGFALIPLAMTGLSVGGLFFISDRVAFAKLFAIKELIISAGLNSLLLGLGAGGLNLLALIFMSLSFQNLKLRKFIASFMPPGASFMGFAFLLLPFYGERFVLIKWVLGLSFLLFPLIYRWRGEPVLDRLSQQVETARFLGAGWGFIFRRIIWPQSHSAFLLCAGVAGFWACGDFAYSLIVSGGHWNLSLLIYDLFSSYRLNEAVMLSWLLLPLSFFVLLFWLGWILS